MLTHQGWFTVLYSIYLLASQSFEFEICTSFYSTPLHYFPFQEDWSRVLAWELRSGSCRYPTTVTRAEPATAKPCQWKSMLIHQGRLLCYIPYTYSTYIVSSLKSSYLFIAHRYICMSFSVNTSNIKNLLHVNVSTEFCKYIYVVIKKF